MKLIVGLGNPGGKYKNNRHNVGYMVVDELRKKPNGGFIAVKSGAMMNESGKAVSRLVNKQTLEKINLHIVHDDLDIPLGKYKIQKGVGPKDHKGLNSIYKSLSTKDFWHVRVGVDNRDPVERQEGEKYVLQDFESEEEKIIKHVISEVVGRLSDK